MRCIPRRRRVIDSLTVYLLFEYRVEYVIGTSRRKASFTHVLGGAPPSRPLARLSSNARVFAAFLSFSCPTRARSSPPDASRLFIAASCAPRRDDDVSPR